MPRAARLELFALPDFPLVRCGDDLAEAIRASVAGCGAAFEDGDIVVVAQKIVSKAEGRIVELASVTPSACARDVAARTGKDARLVEVILSESQGIVRMAPDVLIVRHRCGFVMANAGVDQSNVGPDDGTERVLLLPEDPDRSARTLLARLEAHHAARMAVVVNDSFGRAWRRGTVGVALGVAGLPALSDKRGSPDLFGRPLRVTTIGLADEVAAAASLLMGQADEARPVVVVRGLPWARDDGSTVADLIRPEHEDLFR